MRRRHQTGLFATVFILSFALVLVTAEVAYLLWRLFR